MKLKSSLSGRGFMKRVPVLSIFLMPGCSSPRRTGLSIDVTHPSAGGVKVKNA